MGPVTNLSVTVKDDLPNVLKLEPNGSNWFIFKTHLSWALADCQVFNHLPGTAAKPAATAVDKLAKWEKAELKVQNSLAQRLADSTL